MTVGIVELIWLVAAVLLGLAVVITWIIKSEANRNFFKAEIIKLRSKLDAADNERVMMMEEIDAFKLGTDISVDGQASSGGGSGDIMIGGMMAGAEELEKDNIRLRRELNEARSSLEEVYKALCSK